MQLSIQQYNEKLICIFTQESQTQQSWIEEKYVQFFPTSLLLRSQHERDNKHLNKFQECWFVYCVEFDHFSMGDPI